MSATGASISGSITATSAVFNNATVTGTLNASGAIWNGGTFNTITCNGIQANYGLIGGMSLSYQGLSYGGAFVLDALNSDITCNSLGVGGTIDCGNVLATNVYGYLHMTNYNTFDSTDVPDLCVNQSYGRIVRTLNSASSIRYKNDIKNISDEEWTGVYELRPITYTLKEDHEKRLMYGLVAEEADQVMPNIVQKRKDNCGNQYPDAVDYARLTIPLLKAVQDINERLNRNGII